MSSTEQTYILAAIESLRNEVLARHDATNERLDGVVAHLEKLNGKTAKNANAVARLNLVVFGLGGTLATFVLGIAAKWLKLP
jgi:hypothetical protein